MEYMVEVIQVKLSQEYFTVEYKMKEMPITGQISVHMDEWNDDDILKLIETDVKGKKKLITLLEQIIVDWEGKEIKVDV